MQTEENANTLQTEEHVIIAHTVSELLASRHSARAFLKTPVPRPVIAECFALAQHSASSSNLQPWRAYVLEGAALTRLKAALQKGIDDNLPRARQPVPQHFKHYRSEMGHIMYGPEGYNVAREDTEKMDKVQRRNFDFFDAPLAMIILVDSSLGPIYTLTVGLWLQSVCMLLEERNLKSCLEGSVAGYPQVIREQLSIGENMTILCGMAVGYEDTENAINKIKMARDDWENDIVFLSD